VPIRIGNVRRRNGICHDFPSAVCFAKKSTHVVAVEGADRFIVGTQTENRMEVLRHRADVAAIRIDFVFPLGHWEGCHFGENFPGLDRRDFRLRVAVAQTGPSARVGCEVNAVGESRSVVVAGRHLGRVDQSGDESHYTGRARTVKDSALVEKVYTSRLAAQTKASSLVAQAARPPGTVA